MKKRKDKSQKIAKGFSGALLGIIAFSAMAPMSLIFGALFALGMILLPFTPSPGNVFGTTPPAGETEPQKAERLLFEKIKKNCETDVSEFLKANPDVKAFTDFKATLTELQGKLDKAITADQATTIKTELDKALLAIKALQDASVGANRGAKKGSIADLLASKKSEIDAFVAKKAGTLEIEYKATETSTDIANRDSFFQWHENGAVGQIPVRKPFVRELFRNVGSTSEYVKYLDQATVVRDAENVSLCGTTTHNTKATWTVQSLQIQKVRDFGDICLDMMQDYPFVDAEIRRLFDTSLNLKIDNNFLLSNAVAPNPNSIDATASTFAAANADPTADYSAAITNATIIDLLSVAGAQIQAFGQNNAWMPNYILMNPRDLETMKLLKDTQKNYIKNNTLFTSLFTTGGIGRYFIDGMEIITNPLVPQNEVYIGDFRKGTVYARPGLGIEFSFENNANFEQELVTVKVYERLNLLIRNVDADAFMHIADIEQGVFDISVPT